MQRKKCQEVIQNCLTHPFVHLAFKSCWFYHSGLVYNYIFLQPTVRRNGVIVVHAERHSSKVIFVQSIQSYLILIRTIIIFNL